MSDAIIPASDIAQSLADANLDLQVGDVLIDSSHSLLRISGFKRDRDGDLLVVTEYQSSDARWHHYGDLDLQRLMPRSDGSREYYKLHGTVEDVEAEALAGLNAPPIVEDEDTQTTVLTLSGSGQAKIELLKAELEERTRRTAVLRLVLERKLQKAYHASSVVQKQLRFINRVVEMLETFLGVYQEVVLIQDGLAAPAQAPISIRQQVLYMDEEVGDVTVHHGVMGIDFNRVEDFDAWLLAGNLDRILPESKGIIALQPSRSWREYHADPIINGDLNHQNKFVYLLIRNGEKVYRIWTNLTLKDRLFPTTDEFRKIIEAIEETDNEYSLEKLRDQEMDWRQYALLLQGLIERTECLQPLPGAVSLFDPATFEAGYVKMIRDAEFRLGDGHLPYQEWRRRKNSLVKRGSRIFVGRIEGSWQEYDDRVPYLYRNTVRSRPVPGVYSVEKVSKGEPRYFGGKDDGTIWKILYRPGDDVYSAEEGYQERSLRVAFDIYANHDDFALNYDDVDLEEINGWIANRLERPNYLRMLPLLMRMRTEREKELALERDFVGLVASELGCEADIVWKAVDWWKRKVIQKRPIAQDDHKAWRMIRRQIKSTIVRSPLA